MIQPAYTYEATIDRWVDGDTVWMTVDLGLRVISSTDFRLFGINTPERGQDGYHEAKDRANVLAPVGTKVMIKTYKNPDKYGRWLTEILSGDVNINRTLVDESLAVAYFGGHKD